MSEDWAEERRVVMDVFKYMLATVTGDGSKKRQTGAKPPWWRDSSHEAAIFSHLNKWKHGEKQDKDSGVHPLVHLAWRALAIAYQETYGQVDPQVVPYEIETKLPLPLILEAENNEDGPLLPSPGLHPKYLGGGAIADGTSRDMGDFGD